MSQNSWQETLVWQNIDGTAFNTTAAETSVIAPEAKYTLPANFLKVGSHLKLTCQGRISNIVTSPGTLTWKVKFGSVIVFTSGALNLNVVAKVNVTFWLEILLATRTIGGSTVATMMGVGNFTSESVVGSPVNTAGGAGTLLLPVTAPVVGTGFDSTAAQQIDLTATFSTSNVGNAMQSHMYKLESLN
jgi:hypothetical protein